MCIVKYSKIKIFQTNLGITEHELFFGEPVDIFWYFEKKKKTNVKFSPSISFSYMDDEDHIYFHNLTVSGKNIKKCYKWPASWI